MMYEFLKLMWELRARKISTIEVYYLVAFMKNMMQDLNLVRGGFSHIISHACMTNQIKVVKLITEEVPQQYRHLLNEPAFSQVSLHVAAERGNFEIVEHLLDCGVPPNDIGSKFGCPPLHFAIRFEHIDVVRLLLDRGASVNAKDGRGITPYMMALQYKNKEIIDLLFSCGGKRN